MSSSMSSFGRKVGINTQEPEVLSCGSSNYICSNDPKVFYFLAGLFFIISLGVCVSYMKNFLGWKDNWIKLHVAVDILLLILVAGLLAMPQYTPKAFLHGKMSKQEDRMKS